MIFNNIMTKDSLRQLIKEMVHEEVKQVLPQIIAEIFTSKLNETSSRPVETQQKKIVSSPVPQKREMKIFTKNEALNKALNETVGGIPKEGGMVSSELGSTPSVMDHIHEAPAPVAQALTKNYSALMKAIDKKKSSGSIGSGAVSMM